MRLLGNEVPLARRAKAFAAMLFCGLGISVAGAPPPSSAASCPNEAFRAGWSVHLPDCRAYELVTPPDMNGRVPRTIESAIAYDLFPTELASPVRDSVLFMTSGGPLSEPSGPNGTYDIYEAIRGSSGWETVRRVSPSGEQAVFPNAGGVSSDHWYDFTNAVKIQGGSGGSLSEEGVANYFLNPDGSFELVGMGSLGTERFAQGRFIGPGGEHIIFTTGTGGWCSLSEPCPINQLEPNAPPSGTAAVYDRSADGPTRVVS